MSKTQTLKTIKTQYPALSVRLQGGEFRITVKNPRAEAIAYYTDDVHDALGTAQYIAAQCPRGSSY